GYALGDADGAARIERIKEVRALQHLVVTRQQREAGFVFGLFELAQQPRGLAFVEVEELPERGDVGHLEVVDRELQLVLKTDIAIGEVGRPGDVVDAVAQLEEGREALQTVGELGGDEVQIDAAALLEVGELRDLQAVEHDLPAYAPGAEGGRFPVVFF